jgi:hypothetical protein
VIEHLWWSLSEEAEPPESISVEAVEAAGRLVEEYFVPMAERVLGDASMPVGQQAAMKLARHIRKAKPTKFNARKLGRRLGGDLKSADLMKEACQYLEDDFVIRAVPDREGSTSGRQRLDYEVNPNVLEWCANSDNRANRAANDTNGTIGTAWKVA